MNQGHFSVINKKGVLMASAIMLVAILIFSISLAKRLSGGAGLWTIPVVVAIIIFLLAMMVMVSVITAGIDIQYGKVSFANADGAGGKRPQFGISELENIELHNSNGKIENPSKDNLAGGRVVFFTRDGKTYTYYPVSITAKQYQNIHDGLLKMAKEAREWNEG